MTQPLVNFALAGHRGSLAYFDPFDNQDSLGTLVPLDDGWFVAISTSQNAAFGNLNRVMVSLLVVLGASMAILLGIGLLLARQIARPLTIVTRAATGLATGDLDQQVDVTSQDELGSMAAAFRDMIAYHTRMAAIADAVAGGDLGTEVRPQSDRDRLGIALHGMVAKLRGLVSNLEDRTAQAEDLVRRMKLEVAEREKAEQALRVRDRAMTATRTAIAITDAVGSSRAVVYVNPAFESLTGYSASELYGRSLQIFAGPETNSDTTAAVVQALSEQHALAFTEIQYRKDGTSFWSDSNLEQVWDAAGNVTHILWFLSDATVRLQSEQQAEALARTEHIRALGQMASGIAHDLNQSLTLIANHCDAGRVEIAQVAPNLREIGDLFTIAMQAALDGGETVKRLLLFSHAKLSSESVLIDMGQLVREVAELTAPRWRDTTQAEGRSVTLYVEESGQAVVLGSRVQMREALTNLVFNAVDAMPGGGSIRLSTKRLDDRVIVEAADTGLGNVA